MKDLLKKAVTIFVSYGLNKVFYIFLAIVMARKLGIEGVGAYGLVMAITSMLFIGVGLGGGIVVREFVSNPKKISTYFWSILTLRTFIGIIVFGLTLIIAYFYPTTIEVKKAIVLYGLVLLFALFLNAVRLMFYSLQYFKRYAVTTIIEDFLSIGAAVLFLLLGKGLVWVIVGFIIGRMLTFLLIIIMLWKTKISLMPFNVDFVLWKRFIGKGVYFLMQSLLRLGMFKVDILVLSLVGSLALVGVYQVAYSISFGVSIISSSLAFVMYPIYAWDFAHSKKILKQDYLKTMFYNLILAILTYALLMLFVGIIVELVYGYGFLAAVGIVKILAIATVIHALNQNNSTFLNAVRKEKLNFYFILITFVINIILDLLLIKPYGIQGVAVATVFCSSVYLIISTTVILKYNEDEKFKKY